MKEKRDCWNYLINNKSQEKGKSDKTKLITNQRKKEDQTDKTKLIINQRKKEDQTGCWYD